MSHQLQASRFSSRGIAGLVAYSGFAVSLAFAAAFVFGLVS